MIEGIISSLQGNQHAEFQDYATFYLGEKTEIWLIADGATNATGSGQFISMFCEGLVENLSTSDDTLTPANVLEAITSIHHDIRKDFICAKGSFLLFIVDNASGLQHCFFLGDCRIGSVKDGLTEWRSLPHSLSISQQVQDEQQLCQHPERQILFKTLSARRLAEPEYLQLNLDLSLSVVLATDGFWSNFPARLPNTLTKTNLHSYLQQLQNQSDDITALVRYIQT